MPFVHFGCEAHPSIDLWGLWLSWRRKPRRHTMTMIYVAIQSPICVVCCSCQGGRTRCIEQRLRETKGVDTVWSTFPSNVFKCCGWQTSEVLKTVQGWDMNTVLQTVFPEVRIRCVREIMGPHYELAETSLMLTLLQIYYHLGRLKWSTPGMEIQHSIPVCNMWWNKSRQQLIIQ